MRGVGHSEVGQCFGDRVTNHIFEFVGHRFFFSIKVFIKEVFADSSIVLCYIPYLLWIILNNQTYTGFADNLSHRLCTVYQNAIHIKAASRLSEFELLALVHYIGYVFRID